MRIFIFFLLIVLNFSCRTNKGIVIAKEDMGIEIGKCFFAHQVINAKSNFENGFILELKPARFKDVKIHYTKQKLENFSIDEDRYHLPVKSKYVDIQIKNERLNEFTKDRDPIGFLFCYTEVPAEYTVFTLDSLSENDFIIKEKQLEVKPILIKTYVEEKPNILKENQWYFGPGNWSILKEAEYGSHGWGR